MLLHVRRGRHVDAPHEAVWDDIVEVTLEDEGDGTRVVVVEAPLAGVRAGGDRVQAALPAHGPRMLA